MTRTPSLKALASPGAGTAAIVMTIVVTGSTGYGWHRWNDRVAEATTPLSSSSADDSATGTRDTDDATEPAAVPYEPPTFDVLRATRDRDRPVVLVVGSRVAAGTGAGPAYTELLAEATGWDVRRVAEGGAGYTAAGGDGRSFSDLLESAPEQAAPDLVLVQGGGTGETGKAEVKAAVDTLATSIRDRYRRAVLVAVTPFASPDQSRSATALEKVIARAWRDVPGVLVVRPQLEGWPTVGATDDGDLAERDVADVVERLRGSLVRAGLLST